MRALVLRTLVLLAFWAGAPAWADCCRSEPAGDVHFCAVLVDGASVLPSCDSCCVAPSKRGDNTVPVCKARLAGWDPPSLSAPRALEFVARAVIVSDCLAPIPSVGRRPVGLSRGWSPLVLALPPPHFSSGM